MNNTYKKIEKSIFILLTLIILSTSIGTIIEILPLFKKETEIENINNIRPYTPLELLGLNIYKREGCYTCHSQHIRVLRDEVERYGNYSLSIESIFDFPFLWGSKRTGPDLARIGEKYSDDWHVKHLMNPRSIIKKSIMPSYYFLINKKIKTSNLKQKMKILRNLGVPYKKANIINYLIDINIQANLEKNVNMIKNFQKRYNNVAIRKFYKDSVEITEMDALISYLQGLGNKMNNSNN